MAEYRRGSHTIYDIQYHLVWVTKYRYHVLTGEVAGWARELIRQSCMSRDLKVPRGHIAKDHVHLLVSTIASTCAREASTTISTSCVDRGMAW